MVEKTIYYAKIKFIEPVLGSQPASQSILENYIKSKLEKEIKQIEKALKKAKKEEEILALQEKLEILQKERQEETLLPEVSNRVTVFPRDKEGYICFLNYHFLGYFKEMSLHFLKSGFKNKFSRYVDIRATLDGRYRECYLLRNGKKIKEADYLLERPLRAYTNAGYIISIIASEALEPPLETEFYIVVLGNVSLHGITAKILKELLELGKEKGGISQWRNVGYGKFEVLEFEQVK